MTQALCAFPDALELEPDVIPADRSYSQLIWEQWMEAFKHYVDLPVTRQGIAREFQELAETWRKETGHTSSITEMAMHPAYQRIIGLGKAVVPYLLRELEQRPDHWFWALNAITGVNPVKPENRGRVRRMAEDWLRWGREQRYQWRPVR